MVNMYGAGKAFNLRYAHNSYLPQRVRTGGRMPNMPIFGHHNCGTTNVTINNGPQGFWGFLGGFFSGLFGGGMFGGGMFSGLFGGMFNGAMLGGGMYGGGLNNFGALNSAMGTPGGTQAAQNGNNQASQLANLKSLYGAKGFNIVANEDGTFSATDKNGYNIAMNKKFEDMCKILGEKKPETTTETSEKQGAVATESETTEATSKGSTGTEDANEKATTEDANERTTTPGSAGRTGGANAGRGASAGKAGGATGTQTKQWTDAEKAKPIRLQITVSLRANGSGTATVITPDHKTYKESISHTNATGNTQSAISALSNRILARLNSDGWTNVTLENKMMDYASDGNKPTGNVTKPTTKQWTAAEKQKPITLTISFAVHTRSGNNGSATVTTPDGKLYQVQTGTSWTASRARQDLADKMRDALRNAGWTNVTLQNNNFTDWK